MNNEDFKNDQLNEQVKNVLNEEKNETMNWDFAAFMEQVEPNQESKKIVWFASKKWISVAAAAAILLGLGIWSIFQFDNSKPQNLAENKEIKLKNTSKEEEIKIDKVEEPEVLIAENNDVQSISKATQFTNKKSKEESAYNPEYVIINGEPVYDLELAKQMTLQSLNMFAENVEKSVTSMEHIKHLSIKF